MLDTVSYLGRDSLGDALTIDELVELRAAGNAGEATDDARHRASFLVDQWKAHFEHAPWLMDTCLERWKCSSLDQLRETLSWRPSNLSRVDSLGPVADVWNRVLNTWPLNDNMASRDWRGAIVSLLEPLLSYRRDSVLERLAPTDVLAREAARSYLEEVPERLLALLVPIIALEVNVARLSSADSKLEGEAFAFVIGRLRREPTAMAVLLVKYPVVARALIERSADWADAAAEFGERLSRDAVDLTRLCSGGQLVPLRKVEHGVGDSHGRGRATTLITVSDGTRVAYKPRPVGPSTEVTEFFQRLLGGEPLAIADTIDRRDYGWSVFVENAPCGSSEGVSRYYRRLGEMTAALWFLGATDIHSENVVACGEVPVLIDVETLLTPVAAVPDPWLVSANPQAREAELWRDLPTAMGVLPFLAGRKWKSQGADLSVFGDKPGRRYIDPDGVWADAGTGHMRRETREVTRRRLANQPWVSGTELHTEEFHDDVIAGFDEMLRRLGQASADSAGLEAAVEKLRRARFRCVMRPSALYGDMLREIRHTDYAQSAVACDLYFAVLWAMSELYPGTEFMIDREIEELRRGDLPIHYSGFDATELRSAHGLLNANHFPKTPSTRIFRHAAMLRDHTSISRLTHTVRLSLYAHEENHDPGNWDTTSVPVVTDTYSADVLTRSAIAIGHRLVDQAWPARNDGFAWIAASSEGGMNWDVRVVTDHLYDGTAGIGLYLQRLAEVTGVERFDRAFQRLTHNWLDFLLLDTFKSVGGFEGLGSVIYRLCALDGTRFGAKDEATKVVLNRMGLLLDSGSVGTDIIGGAAGAILALLRSRNFLAVSACQQVDQLVEGFADFLANTAVDYGHGLGWARAADDDRYFLGFSHGVAGIACALRLAAGSTSDSGRSRRWTDVAAQAEQLERHHFHPERDNWDDLRDVGAGGFSFSWCNGNVGIGMGRALVLRDCVVTDDERQTMTDELAAAVRCTRTTPQGGGHTLCHGDAGSIDFLLLASSVLGDSELLDHARAMAMTLAHQCPDPTRPPKTGHRHAIESPGLLNGSAGTGYQLLRVAHPSAAPSVLALEVS